MFRRFTSVLSTAVPLALAAGVLAACSTAPSEPTASEPASGRPGEPVTLVTYDSYAISKSTLREFTDQTGYPVEIVRAGDAAEVVNRALLTKGTPEGDVLFGLDNNLLSRALGEELFQPHAAADLDQIPQQYRLDPENRVTPIDVGDVCVNFDRSYFQQRGIKPPQTLSDLATPPYRDLLVVQNPATSTPGLAFMLATVAEFGPERFADYWQRLRDNGVQVENSWDASYYKAFSGGSGEGDRPLVVSYASSPPAEVVFADEPPARAPTGVLLDTCYRQIEFAGLLTGAPNPAGGQALLDFMITRTYQEDLPLQNFVFPVRADAELPVEFKQFAEVAQDPLSLPPADVAANRDRWVSIWTDVMQR